MKHILVTGLHRSGTTWLGRTLAYAPHTGYVHEPFNITLPAPYVHKPFDHWFQYVDVDNESRYRLIFDPVLHHEYPTLRNLAKAKRVSHVARVLRRKADTYFHRLTSSRLVIKDPIAFFSTDWLHKTYDLKVVTTLRHPAAFCASLKVQGWRFNFKNFTDQPVLMERYLQPFADEIHGHIQQEFDVIEQGILLWKCFYYTLKLLENDISSLVLVRHEDLSLNPVQRFERLYAQLDLDFTPSVRSKIEATTGAHNPVEPSLRDEFRRDSLRNILNWKVRLTAAEIERVYRATWEFAQERYPLSDW